MKEYLTTNISKRLQYELKKRNLSIHAFSKLLGRNYQSVLRIVTGKNKRYIKEEVIEEYAAALGLKVSDLVDVSGEYDLQSDFMIKNITERLQYELKERNLSVYAFAKLLGKPHQGVYRVVSGKNKRYITEKLIEEYAAALSLDKDVLLTPLPKEQKKI